MNKGNRKLISDLDGILPKSKIDRYSVLMIDDEKKNLTAFKGLFRRDYNVFTATCRDEALSIVSSNNIDFVFCDYKMPKFNGADILKEIVNICPNIDRAILTAYNSSSIIEEFKLKSNTEDVILKPYSVDDINSRIFNSKQLAS